MANYVTRKTRIRTWSDRFHFETYLSKYVLSLSTYLVICVERKWNYLFQTNKSNQSRCLHWIVVSSTPRIISLTWWWQKVRTIFRRRRLVLNICISQKSLKLKSCVNTSHIIFLMTAYISKPFYFHMLCTLFLYLNSCSIFGHLCCSFL